MASMLDPFFEKPGKPLSNSERKKYTVIFAAVFIAILLCFNVLSLFLTNPYEGLPIWYSSKGEETILLFLIPAGVIVLFFTRLRKKGTEASFRKWQIAIAIVLALLVTIIDVFEFTSVPFSILLFVAMVATIYLMDLATRYGLTSGINLFLLCISLYTLAVYLLTIFAGGSIGGFSIFIPFLVAIALIAVGYYFYEDLFGSFSSLMAYQGIGGSSTLYFLLAPIAVVSVISWVSYLTSPIFYPLFSHLGIFATYLVIPNSGSAQSYVLSGGILYLLSGNFPLVLPSSQGGIGSFDIYLNYLALTSSLLAGIEVPEYVHALIFTIGTILLSLVSVKIWVWLTKQGDAVARQRAKIYRNTAVIALIVCIGTVCGLIISPLFFIIAGGTLCLLQKRSKT